MGISENGTGSKREVRLGERREKRRRRTRIFIAYINQFQLTPMRAPRLIQKNSIVYIPLNYNLKRGKHI